jgi:hypothetical protein
MKRDMDLLRAILLAVESNDDPQAVITPTVEGYTELQVCHHIALLADAGLLSARERSAIGVYYWSAGQLTWAGHEFLDCVRDDALWAEVKRLVQDASAGQAFRLLEDTALARLRQRIEASGPA